MSAFTLSLSAKLRALSDPAAGAPPPCPCGGEPAAIIGKAVANGSWWAFKISPRIYRDIQALTARPGALRFTNEQGGCVQSERSTHILGQFHVRTKIRFNPRKS